MAIFPFTAPESIHGNHGAFEGASTMVGALNTLDGETFGVNWNGGGAGESSCTLAAPISPVDYVLHLQVKTFGTITAASTIRFGLTDASGFLSWGPLIGVGFNGTLHLVDYVIPYVTSDAGHTANRLWFQTSQDAADAGKYTLFDLITGEPNSVDYPVAAGATATMTGNADVARTLVTTSGTGTGEVVFVDEFTVDFVPGGGSNIVSVILDGVDAGAITTHTFATPALDHIIAVVFDAAVNCATSYTYGTLPGEGMNRESLGGPNPVSSRNEKRLGFVAKARNFYFPSGEGPA